LARLMHYILRTHKQPKGKKMEIITIKTTEGKRVKGYKVRVDQKGEYIKRFGMIGRLTKRTKVSENIPDLTFIDYTIDHYTD